MAVFVEVFIFNNRTFQTVGYHEHVLDIYTEVELIGGRMDENGVIWIEPGVEDAVLVFSGPDVPVKNARIDVECVSDEMGTDAGEHACSVGILAFDDLLYERLNPDGSSYVEPDVLAMVSGTVLHDIDESKYIYLNPFGDTHTIVFSLHPLSDQAQGLKIHEIKLNAVRPLMVLPLRLLLVFVVLLILYGLFFDSILWQVECVQIKKWGNIALVCISVLFAGTICWWMAGNRTYSAGIIPEMALIVLLVVLIGKIIYQIIKEHYKRIPLGLFLLMWGGLVGAMYIPAIVSGIDPGNHIPVLLGVSLMFIGLYGLLNRGETKSFVLREAMSGACIVTACILRPVLLVYGLIILVFYMSDKRKVSSKIAFGLPFAVGLILCVVFNLLRIDMLSVMGMRTDTNISPRQTGGFLPYVIYRAAYEYLFKPAYWDMEFPFTEYASGERVGVAGSLLSINLFRGGLISSNPFTFLLVLIGIYRKKLQEKNLFFLILTGGCAGVFVMVYDTVLTGTLCTGYTLDFSFVFIIPACILLMELYESSLEFENERIRRIIRYFVSILLLVSVVWGIMQLGAINPESFRLQCEGSEQWYRLFYTMRVLR